MSKQVGWFTAMPWTIGRGYAVLLAIGYAIRCYARPDHVPQVMLGNILRSTAYANGRRLRGTCEQAMA